VSVKLYIEGGGDGQHLDPQFRQGWSQFFQAAGLVGRMPRIVRGGGRYQTFDMFRTAVRQAQPGVLPLLLVDSETPVATGHTVWQHLKAQGNWDRPSGAADDQAFLMVQVMETWLLADRDLLKEYFGASWRRNHLRQWPDLEQVPKATILDALDKATAGCAKRYSKGKISFELLGKLRPDMVSAACPHAKALLDRLQAL
jgi:uncharacterized protein DUF4276